jgi:hypothetical protein
LVAAHSQIDLFYDDCNHQIERWTTTDGVAFSHTSVPTNDHPISASAALDGMGNLYVASERVNLTDFTTDSALQTSADGWLTHRLGPGRFPRLTATPTGELHVLRWGNDEEYDRNRGRPFFYSNSLRGFQTWTELPLRTQSSFDQDLLPLVVNRTRQQLHAVVPIDGVRFCTSAHTGLANSTGTSWSCKQLDNVGNHPDAAVAPDGTIHVAWGAPGKGLGYANSLGSFLATNFTPQVSYGVPSGGASAVTVPVRISDADGDEIAGHIQVGRYQPVMSVIEPGTMETILNDAYSLQNTDNSYLYDPLHPLQFRVVGTTTFVSELYRSGLTLPVEIEVRNLNAELLGGFFIASWDGAGVTIVHNGFVPHTKLPFSGAPPSEIDISTLPLGSAMVAIGVSDRVTSSFAAQAFTKTAGQTRLVLTKF